MEKKMEGTANMTANTPVIKTMFSDSWIQHVCDTHPHTNITIEKYQNSY